MNRYQENCASVISFNLLKKVIMTCHHITPRKHFFLKEKNVFFKNFLFEKFFFLIILAVFSTACSSSSDSSGDSSSSKDSKSQKTEPPKVDTLPQCLKKTLNSQSLDKGQTKKFSYSCSIAQDVKNKTLTISHTPNSAIKLAPTQIAIPDQDFLKGDFMVKGLQIGSTVQISSTIQVSIKIKVDSDTEEFQFKVTQPYVPKIGEFTITPIPPKPSADIYLDTEPRRLTVYDNKLYVFEDGKYFFSSDGTNWIQKAPDVQKFEDSNGEEIIARIRPEQSFVVWGNKLWALGETILIWSRAGTTWENHNPSKNLVVKHGDGASAIWDNKIWLFGSNSGKEIQSSPNGLDWATSSSVSLPKVTQFFSAIQHQNQIFLMGGANMKTKVSYDTVYSFDGKQFQQAGTLPKSNFGYGLEYFAGGLVVVGGDYFDDSKTRKSLNSLWYSPYGSYWYVIADDLTKGGTDAPTGAVYSMVKWQPKKGSHSKEEALWISDNKKIYKITYTKE